MGRWSDPTDTNYEGHEVLKHRRVHSKSVIPTMITIHLDETRDMYLLEMSEKALVIEAKSKNTGFYHVDTFVSYLRWEAFQPSANSTNCLLRLSYQFKWTDKPWLAANIVQNRADERAREVTSYLWTQFFPESFKEYLEKKAV